MLNTKERIKREVKLKMEKIEMVRGVIRAGNQGKRDKLADILRDIFSIAEKADKYKVTIPTQSSTEIWIECDEKRYPGLESLLRPIEGFIFPHTIIAGPGPVEIKCL